MGRFIVNSSAFVLIGSLQVVQAQNLYIGPSTDLYLSANASVFIHGTTTINSTGSIQATSGILWFYDAVTNPNRVSLDASSSLGIQGSTFVLSNQTNQVLESIDVGANGELELPAGNTLTINSAANAGSILLNADNTNGGRYAQLKVNGPYPPGNSGTVSAYQYLPSTGWHLLSSPISAGFNASTSLLDATKLYGYDGASWMTQGQNLSTLGAGYIGLVGSGGVQSAPGIFASQGAPNTSVTYNLAYLSNSANGGSGTGWNLVGNPFTCNLDFIAFKNANSGISNAYYVWDPTAASGAGVYKYFAANAISGQYLNASATLSGTIPPFQGFWVQSTSSGQSLSFSMANHGTVSNATPLLKTAPDNLILSVVDVTDTSLQDALWLGHDPQQSRSFDLEGDAWKMDNGTGVPNIWSEHNGKRFAVNAFNLMDGTPIPIGFSSSYIGRTYQIHMEQVTSGGTFGGTVEDLVTGLVTDLSQNDLVFVHHDIVGPRFLLYPTSTLGTVNSEVVNASLSYYVNGQVHFTQAFNEASTVSVYSTAGQLVATKFDQHGDAIALDLAQGMYTVVVQGSTTSMSNKLNVVR
jgi:hypothetical protein